MTGLVLEWGQAQAGAFFGQLLVPGGFGEGQFPEKFMRVGERAELVEQAVGPAHLEPTVNNP